MLENSCTLLERVWNGTFFCGRQFGNFCLKTKCISIGPAFPPLGFMLLKFPKMVDCSIVGRKTGANEMPNNGGLDARKHSGSEVDLHGPEMVSAGLQAKSPSFRRVLGKPC